MAMYKPEIETKFEDVNPHEMVQKLSDLNAEMVYWGPVCSRYYDFADGRMKEDQTSMRLRYKTLSGDVDWTTKKRISNNVFRICEERELPAGSGYEDFETAHRMLLQIPEMKLRQEFNKHRITFAINEKRGQTRFEIDTIIDVAHMPAGIPPWLEIEGPTEEAIEEYAGKLGFLMNDAIPRSTRSMIERALKRNSK